MKAHPYEATQDVLVALGRIVREQRLGRSVTQQQLAARIGVDRRTVAAIEAGDPNVAIGRALDAAWAMGLPLFGTGDPAELRRLSQVTGARAALLPAKATAADDDASALDF